ncbi:MAG: Ig-like domain-containing protein [Pseudomonadota bacterium]
MLLLQLRRAALVLLAAATCAVFAAGPVKNKAPTVTLTSPVSGATFSAPATVPLAATAADTDGTIAKVEFFRGTTLIGSVTTAPYNYTWTGVAAGSYSITAKATDNAGAATSSTAASITVSAVTNAPPTVTLTSPANGASYGAPATIQLAANAADSNGTIAKVEFFRGGTTLIGTATAAPYTFNWTNVAVGAYSITAKATDNAGATATSSAAAINVVNSSTLTTITSPTPATLFNYPITDVTGTFNGTADTTVLVSNGNNSTILSTLTGTTTFIAKNVPLSPGANTLTATAVRRDGTSSSASVTVDVPQRLVVLTSPTLGASYEMPPNLTFQASTLLSSGTVQRVDYFRNGVGKLGTATSPPYAFTLGNPAKGSYTVYALMVDDKGVSRQSQQISFTVAGPNVAPSVSLTAPANNAAFGAPASITLQASASDSDGTVGQVEFLQNGQYLGSTNVAPYSFVVSGLGVGAYAFTARATDDKGASTTSAPVSVMVATPPSVTLSTSASAGKVAAGSSVALNADASGSGSPIARVEFYANSTLIGTSTTAPFSFVWSNVALGNYSLTARAVDTAGIAATSAPVSLSVVPGPNVSVTAPVGGTNFFAPAAITITANASTVAGSITSVAFFQNGTPLGTVIAAPYSWVWNNAPAGSYALTAVATDDQGTSSTSTVVNISVGAPTIVLDAPLAGASVGPEGALVRGHISAPKYSGVTVNGAIAFVDSGGNFYANGIVPLESQITAALSTVEGALTTSTVTVSAGASATSVVTVEDEESIGPVNPKFTFRNANGIGQLDIDYLGSGMFNFSTANDPSFVTGRKEIVYTLSFGSLGVIRPIFRITDMLGNVTTQQLAVTGVDPVKMDLMLKDLWMRLLAKVRTGDVEGALNGVTAGAQGQYRSIFQNLQPDAATAVDQLGTLEGVTLSIDHAEYVILRQKAGGTVGYPVYFIRDNDGVWRVDAM